MKDYYKKQVELIQGMSGSPIIQDGKFVGAVTHVMVNNPEKGYGIFADTMLKTNERSRRKLDNLISFYYLVRNLCYRSCSKVRTISLSLILDFK